MPSMTDAEWLRDTAVYFERGNSTYEPQGMSEDGIARLRSIAAKLERPAVDAYIACDQFDGKWRLETTLADAEVRRLGGGGRVRITIEPV